MKVLVSASVSFNCMRLKTIGNTILDSVSGPNFANDRYKNILQLFNN
jgi:hypothetical protein